jgi:hypothetical protein
MKALAMLGHTPEPWAAAEMPIFATRFAPNRLR